MDKIYKIFSVLVVACLLLAIAYSTVNMGRLRSDIAGLEERNRQLELEADRSAEIIDRIASRVADAKCAIAGASTSVEKIRRLIDAIEAISLDLRK